MITMRHMGVSRRNFLKVSAGTGLTLAFDLPALAQSVPGVVFNNETDSFIPNAFVRVGTDNVVTVIIKHIEFGQGTFTGLATLVAEEMDADWDQVRCEHAPADASRYNNLNFGPIQGTGGSSAIANAYMQMRQAGAVARHMLRAAAAAKWGVPAEEIRVHSGILSHPSSQQQATFGEMAELAATMPVPLDIQLKSADEFTLIGAELERKDTGKTDGSAIYTLDVDLPGMVTTVVAHAPGFGYSLDSFDDTQARKIPGVIDIFAIPSGVAVVASDFWSAKQGRDRLNINWNDSKAFRLSSSEIMQRYRDMAQKQGNIARQDGDPEPLLAGADKVFEAEYEFPFLAHAAMEPMNCVARIKPGQCELWYGAQLQTVDQGAVAKLLNLDPAAVKINTLYAGGSFGRRGNISSDYVIEAVEVARKLKPGTPVKLIWTREDDMLSGYFRPMYYHKLRANLGEDGMPIAWHHRIVGQSIVTGTAFGGMVQNGVDQTSVEGASNLPYRIPNLMVDLHTPEDINVPVLWWRSVGSTHTAYSTETFIDELAVASGIDPVQYRLKLLTEHPRHTGVLKLAAEKAEWNKSLPAGKARGVAVHESFNSYVAQVVEISLDSNNEFTIDRVVCAVDCGVVVNPDIVRAQMEGGIGYGLSPALMSEITLEQGRITETNFHNYRVLRMDSMPEIEVHLVTSNAPPTGVGEPGTPVIIPALANAIYAGTGKRHYRLPFQSN